MFGRKPKTQSDHGHEADHRRISDDASHFFVRNEQTHEGEKSSIDDTDDAQNNALLRTAAFSMLLQEVNRRGHAGEEALDAVLVGLWRAVVEDLREQEPGLSGE